MRHERLRHYAVVAGVGLALGAAAPLSAQITQVDPATLVGTQTVAFGAVPGGPTPGTNYDNVLIVDGLSFGERFAGQTITAAGNFDVVGGAPAGGLTLLPGDALHNLVVFQSPAGAVLSGLGSQGYPIGDALGEGAISILFPSGQSEFGFRLAGGHGANIFISFFRADGSLIQSATLANIPLIGNFGFTRDGGVPDIRGVSIWNDDVTGIGISNVRFNVPVPEPATWAMMLLGFGFLGFVLRRQAAPTIIAQQA